MYIVVVYVLLLRRVFVNYVSNVERRQSATTKTMSEDREGTEP